MRAIAALATVFLAALLPAALQAKGSATVRACGPRECAPVGDGTLAAHVASPQETVDPPAVSPYYRLDIGFGAGESASSYSTLFVPAEGLIASNAGGLLWYLPRTEAFGALREATRGVDPYAVPRAWPRYVETPDPSWFSGDPAADGRSWAPVGIAGGVLLLALAVSAGLARRLRLARPSRA